MAFVCRHFAKELLRGSYNGLYTRGLPASSNAKAIKEMNVYWENNRKKDRPISPHVSIFQTQLTWTLSVTHRMTGIILTAPFIVGPIAYLFASKDFGTYLNMMKSVPTFGEPLIQMVKFALALSFSFHLLNGVRHLAWDAMYGFELSTVYKTGYAVLGLSIIFTMVLMFI
ncbi:hypothetical protein CHS0354_020254 [Potamilus streckersoni]|uniref:Succinate dehydrogenase cytochrome b560 subunit, mitochondrial n=1 Tax=Potamilus streckersoni TaxID=2493646 RepID=A0AAE0VPE2_9BIVA|nr:hypothetical protein CHS0354_020254 [Potamilus streckersoni]